MRATPDPSIQTRFRGSRPAAVAPTPTSQQQAEYHCLDHCQTPPPPTPTSVPGLSAADPAESRKAATGLGRLLALQGATQDGGLEMVRLGESDSLRILSLKRGTIDWSEWIANRTRSVGRRTESVREPSEQPLHSYIGGRQTEPTRNCYCRIPATERVFHGAMDVEMSGLCKQDPY
eukprot:GHVU01086927.1.p1 GENE.GHVU01086927.1~~GHVU01086927.1.p1  ORF type:complete len:176 (+),score=9.48 GHVU01086927.1:337-864(+)